MLNEKKIRIPLWIYPSTEKKVKELFEEDNCKSPSEFIENAIIFYSGFLSAEDNKKYLPNIVTSTMKGIVQESENRISRLLFKLAVEQSMTMNVLAAQDDIDDMTLSRLRARCVDQVKKTNGMIRFENIAKSHR